MQEPASAPAERPAPSRPIRALWGQGLALGLAVVLVWLHTGFDFSGLGAPLDLYYLVVLGLWVLALLVLILWWPRRAPRRPWTGFLVALGPAMAGLGAACLVGTGVPDLDNTFVNCNLLLAAGFWAERLRFAGLLATGTLWLGSLVVLWPRRSGADDDRDTGRRGAWWVHLLALVMFAAAAVWSLLDPAMPAHAEIGGPAVRGAWLLAGVALAFWAAASLGRKVIDRRQGMHALTAMAAACLGVVSAGAGVLALHRASALFGLAFDRPGDLVSGRAAAGVVAATILARALPFVLAGLLAAALVAFFRSARSGRVPILAGLGVLAAGAGLGIGYESAWRSSYQKGCGTVVPEEIVLPSSTTRLEVPVVGPLLVVGTERSWLDGSRLEDPKRPDLSSLRERDSEDLTVRLAVDGRVTFGRLYEHLRAAGEAGWVRFHLIVQQPGDRDCLREERLYGVCLSRHPALLRAVSFELPNLDDISRAPPGVVANVIVEPGGMEVSFGGFGAPAEQLDAMGRKLPDRLGARDLAGLALLLEEVHARHPGSRTLILLPFEDLPAEELVDLLDRVHPAGKPAMFPQVVVSRIVR